MNYPSLSLSQASIENVFATRGSKERVQSKDTATRIYRPNIKKVLSKIKHRDYISISNFEDAFEENFANKTLTEKFANNDVQKCGECEFKTSIQEQMRQHMLIKHSGIQHKCPQCEYSLLSKQGETSWKSLPQENPLYIWKEEYVMQQRHMPTFWIQWMQRIRPSWQTQMRRMQFRHQKVESSEQTHWERAWGRGLSLWWMSIFFKDQEGLEQSHSE